MLRGYSQATWSKKNAFAVCLSLVCEQSMVSASRASFRISSAMDNEHCVLRHSTDTECQSALYTSDWISSSRGKYCLGPIPPGILNTSCRIIRTRGAIWHVKRTRSFGIEVHWEELCFLNTCASSRTYSRISKARVRECFPHTFTVAYRQTIG